MTSSRPYLYITDTDEHGHYIQCGRCHRKSYSAEDIREQYCGYCHVFHGEPLMRSLTQDSPRPIALVRSHLKRLK